MINFNKLLLQLLSQEDCVILPDFGGFIVQKFSAELNSLTHRFEPPSRKIAFNEQLAAYDLSFAKFVASENTITVEEAEKLVVEFITSIKDSLSKNGLYDLKDLGRFTLDKTNKIQFESRQINLLNDSFGLPELHFTPIERQVLQSRPAQKSLAREEKGNTGVLRVKKNRAVLLVIPALLFLGAGLFVLSNKNTQVMEASLLSKSAKTQEIAKVETPAVATMPTTVNTTEISETVTTKVETSEIVSSEVSKEYSIIIGSFTKKENAEKLVDSLGGDASFEETENSFFRVSVAKYSEREKALEMLNECRTKFGKETWLKITKN